jgi:mRNA interferase MazF
VSKPVSGRYLYYRWDGINRLPLVVTVIVGTKGENVPRDYPTNVRLSPDETVLPMETDFLCFQVRSLDPQRFPERPAGRVSGDVLRRVEDRVRYCLGL